MLLSGVSAPSPVLAQAVPAKPLLKALGAWDQCGGLKGECDQYSNTQCVDNVYSDLTCPSGYVCYRISPWLVAAPAVLSVERGAWLDVLGA